MEVGDRCASLDGDADRIVFHYWREPGAGAGTEPVEDAGQRGLQADVAGAVGDDEQRARARGEGAHRVVDGLIEGASGRGERAIEHDQIPRTGNREHAGPTIGRQPRCIGRHAEFSDENISV